MRIGRPALTDPVLSQQFQIDKTVCLGDREKADLSGVTMTNGGLVAAQNRSNAADAVLAGCMAQRGYVLVTAADLLLPPPAEGSREVAKRVVLARERQAARYAAIGLPHLRSNAAV